MYNQSATWHDDLASTYIIVDIYPIVTCTLLLYSKADCVYTLYSLILIVL